MSVKHQSPLGPQHANEDQLQYSDSEKWESTWRGVEWLNEPPDRSWRNQSLYANEVPRFPGNGTREEDGRKGARPRSLLIRSKASHRPRRRVGESSEIKSRNPGPVGKFTASGIHIAAKGGRVSWLKRCFKSHLKASLRRQKRINKTNKATLTGMYQP